MLAIVCPLWLLATMPSRKRKLTDAERVAMAKQNGTYKSSRSPAPRVTLRVETPSPKIRKPCKFSQPLSQCSGFVFDLEDEEPIAKTGASQKRERTDNIFFDGLKPHLVNFPASNSIIHTPRGDSPDRSGHWLESRWYSLMSAAVAESGPRRLPPLTPFQEQLKR